MRTVMSFISRLNSTGMRFNKALSLLLCLLALFVSVTVCAAGWSTVAPMSTARQYHTATLLTSGKVLVAGGQDINFSPLSSAEIYDPVANTWSTAGNMATAREGHAAY